MMFDQGNLIEARPKRSLLARFFDGLLHSRRVRAERTLRRYDDVISRIRHGIARELELRRKGSENANQ